MNSPKKFLFLLAASALAIVSTGCNHTVSQSKQTSVSSDGTVKTKETTVTQRPDGSVVKTEETKKSAPVRP